MAINEWKIWKQIGIVKEKKEFVNIDRTMQIILDFLDETGPALKNLASLCSQFKVLRNNELKMKKDKAGKNELRTNIHKQIKKYDAIMKAYELLELDTDVNGERIKKIANELTLKAKKLKANKDLLNKVTKSEHWTFDW